MKLTDRQTWVDDVIPSIRKTSSGSTRISSIEFLRCPAPFSSDNIAGVYSPKRNATFLAGYRVEDDVSPPALHLDSSHQLALHPLRPSPRLDSFARPAKPSRSSQSSVCRGSFLRCATVSCAIGVTTSDAKIE
ncbi:Hypothetical protein NTJ_08480 [Nesidiocoris tenuis]|uniref:Uncharacterized protein n=1 Tax=Nesidiocoris tenuis TaxID=355587 RepID=A0ABN7AXT1_9HEMI|nr:Hypothetical protein NTJ_08480 [Nesidiocoris tenuis]